jgi:hypothetical protein
VIALGELQAALRDALLGEGATGLAPLVAGDGLAPAARLDIYRHHVFTTLTAALESTYPVVCRLVDRRFFAYAADAYIRATPPGSPCLFEYGATFPEFLAAFPPCREHAFLPDVARLEWAMNVALHADDGAPFDPARLAALGAADIPRLAFRFDPSVSLVASPWPIDRIWRASRDDAAPATARGSSTSAERIDLAVGGVRLEVRRLGADVVMRALAQAEFAFRASLLAGQPLEQAVAASLAADPAFDLTRALFELLDERIAVGVAVSN